MPGFASNIKTSTGGLTIECAKTSKPNSGDGGCQAVPLLAAANCRKIRGAVQKQAPESELFQLLLGDGGGLPLAVSDM